jgi:hypothetical protein
MDNNLPKYSKEEVDYKLSTNPVEHRCGICEHLFGHHGEHGCQLVAGSIDDMFGCKLFSPDLIKKANDKINVATNPPEE